MAHALRLPSRDTEKASRTLNNHCDRSVCLADLRCIDACSSIRGSLIYLKLRCGTRHEWTFWLWGKPQGSPALGRGRGWPMFKVLKRSEGEDLQWSVLFPSPLQMDKDLSGRLSRVAYKDGPP